MSQAIINPAYHPVSEYGSQGRPEDHAPGYFAHCRFDILAHIPPRCVRILSVGCGAGFTEAQLLRRGAEVVGIEINPQAAEVARSHGIEVIEADATRPTEQLLSRSFDCLIFADILEHLTDPVGVLHRYVQMLEPEGVAIISVPNFRHWMVFWHLFARGQVPSADAGIFDRTHLRITTRRLVERWLSEVGLRRCAFSYPMPRRIDRWPARASLGLLREICARQVIVVGARASANQPGGAAA